MSLLSVPFTYSAGAVIIASQLNTCNSTIYSDYSGNVDNTNIASGAAIAYSKLNLATSIVNADISASAAIVDTKLATISTAGKVNISALTVASQAQGDIIYASSATAWARLGPGTSGQFLKTQGAAANPIWAAAPTLSNVLFQYSAAVTATGVGEGERITTSLTSTGVTGSYRFLQTVGGSTVVWSTKWIKIAGVSTVTVYAQIWQNGTETAGFTANVGGQTGTVSGTGSQTTPEWKSTTVDVSSLTNGNVYDVSMTLTLTNANGTKTAFMGNVVSFGS